MQENKAIRELFNRYLQNKCTRDEIKRLLHHFNAGHDETLLKQLIREQLENEELEQVNGEYQSLLDQVFKNVKLTITASDKENTIPSPGKKRIGWGIAAAASILVLMAGAVIMLFVREQPSQIAVVEQKNQKSNIAPGRSHAVLMLADGSVIVLDSVANGALAQQGNSKVFKLNGQIAYNKTGATVDGVPVYNQITTARGNQFELILSDGTKVWLNAASSLRFPTAFIGTERRVEVWGEAYFEVAKNPSRPFKVAIHSASGNEGEVEVLGTHFNINAYDDEAGAKTTLLEGAVKIHNSKSSQVLLPGQQAELTGRAITINNNIDVLQAVAWKEGFFLFNNTELPSLMRQVARWYDVEVVFNGKVPQEGFSGKISRSVPLKKLLKVLELNDIKVRLEGKKLIITP